MQRLTHARHLTTSSSLTFNNRVALLHLQRPAFDFKFWDEFKQKIDSIKQGPSRCVVLSQSGKMFSAGLDVKDPEILVAIVDAGERDPARRANRLRKTIEGWQECFSELERLPQPVISCVHSACVGAGVDLICATDIRYCTHDAYFSIREVDVGLCPDLGTLQRIERIFKSSSLVRELAFTGRKMTSKEALDNGFVSRVFATKDEMLLSALALATDISYKSPVAVSGIKNNMNQARGRPVEDGLKYQAVWSSVALQTGDVAKGLDAALSPGKEKFSFDDA